MEDEGDRSKLIVGAIVVGLILVTIVYFVIRGMSRKKTTTQSALPIFTTTPTPTPSSVQPSSVTPTPLQQSNGTTKGGLTYPNGQYVQPTTYYYYQQSQGSGNSGSQDQSGSTQTQTLPNGMTQTQSY